MNCLVDFTAVSIVKSDKQNTLLAFSTKNGAFNDILDKHEHSVRLREYGDVQHCETIQKLWNSASVCEILIRSIK
ncbi:unnamed protein product [Onchocerca flexuosa]|nr:unnamed protein product [Onchocerca flexuosa]